MVVGYGVSSISILQAPTQTECLVTVGGIEDRLLGRHSNDVTILMTLHPCLSRIISQRILNVNRTITALHDGHGSILLANSYLLTPRKVGIARTKVGQHFAFGRTRDNTMLIYYFSSRCNSLERRLLGGSLGHGSLGGLDSIGGQWFWCDKPPSCCVISSGSMLGITR